MATGDGTFGGQTFFVLQEGDLARADTPRRSVTAERLAVGGGRRVRQVLGFESSELALNLEFDAAADLATFRGLVGTIGTLTTDGGAGTTTYTSYYLDRIENVTVDDTSDKAFCTATWKAP